MRFRHVTHDGASFYCVGDDGGLYWYKDRNGQGQADWDGNSGNRIGVGWDRLVHVVAGSRQGELYVTTTDGELLWYRDTARDGSNDSLGRSGWDHRSGQVVGHGWLPLRAIFPGPDGVLYAVTPAGDLLWYKHLIRPDESRQFAPGSPVWANGGTGQRIGVGWDQAHRVLASRRAAPPQSTNDYVIYVVRRDGELCWYHDDRADGSSRPDGTGWSELSGTPIGVGWDALRVMTCGAAGVFYGAREDGRLCWFQDILRDGQSRPDGYGWARNNNSPIGTDWFTAVNDSGPSDGGHDDDNGGGSVDPPGVPVGSTPDDPEETPRPPGRPPTG